MNTLIIGMGEIGRSLCSLIQPGKIYTRDMSDPDWEIPEGGFGIMHVAIRYSETFVQTVIDYAKEYDPKIISVLTTTVPGTCELIENETGIKTCHSTTRGLHPHLQMGMQTIVKHIGGPLPAASILSEHFGSLGIECVIHQSARTTELLHVLNNCHYGINLMFADEASKLCRQFGVDYSQYMFYTATNNEGYTRMGHDSKVRPVLTPPGGKIGGHCVSHSAGLIPDEMRTPMIEMLSKYNERKEK